MFKNVFLNQMGLGDNTLRIFRHPFYKSLDIMCKECRRKYLCFLEYRINFNSSNNFCKEPFNVHWAPYVLYSLLICL